MRKKTTITLIALLFGAVVIALTITTLAYANPTTTTQSAHEAGALAAEIDPYPAPDCKNNAPYPPPYPAPYPGPSDCGYLPIIYNVTAWLENMLGVK
jgi:hypothetical protein